MPGKGFPPKPPEQRRRRNKDVIPTMHLDIVPEGDVRGPSLPEGILPKGEEWHPMTRAMYDTLRTSPQVHAILDTDWMFLIDTMLLHHIMWSAGKWEHAGEVRLRLAKFGITPEDRARLRMNVSTGPQERKKKEALPVASERAKSLRTALKVIDAEVI